MKDKPTRKPKKRGPKPEILKLDVDPLAGIQRLLAPKPKPSKPGPKKPG